MATYTYLGQTIVAPLSIRSNQPVFSEDTISLKQRRVSQGAQRWELTFNIETNNPVDFFAMSVSAFANNTPGLMTMPQIQHRGELPTLPSGTILINRPAVPDDPDMDGDQSIAAGYLAGVSTLTISGGSGALPAGYFIKFSNHDKIYMVITGPTATRTSATTLNIFPALVAPVAHEEPILTGDAAVLSYRQDVSNLNGITYSDGILADAGSITIIEAL